MSDYLAVDIGASGGRHMLGRTEQGGIRLEEIYRFPNEMHERGGTLCWDIDALFGDVSKGAELCAERGLVLAGTGIDTWGVDFILLDGDDSPVGPAVSYRDGRTAGMDAVTEKLVPFDEHYARTGTQKQLFNTVYQLMALKLTAPELLGRAGSMLLMPDYLHWRLTGEKRAEFTAASTTGLLNALTKDWDWEIIDRLGLPRRIFLPVAHGLVPGHDTANAFLAADGGEDTVILNSGTWSLLGVFTAAPVLTDAAREAGFTNEGGFGGTNRFLKTIMGMWMIQSVRRELPGKPAYEELSRLARESAYDGIINVADPAFYAPQSMSGVIALKCAEAGYRRPESAGDILRCACASLAKEYANSVRKLEALTGRKFTSISMIGGGSRNDLINELTALETGLPVNIGAAEATALGNIKAQMLISGEWGEMNDPI
jgi:rhamnulokinase